MSSSTSRRTARVTVLIPPALFAAAARSLGLGADASPSHVLRAALADLAGEDVTKHTPRVGRPPKRRAA